MAKKSNDKHKAEEKVAGPGKAAADKGKAPAATTAAGPPTARPAPAKSKDTAAEKSAPSTTTKGGSDPAPPSSSASASPAVESAPAEAPAPEPRPDPSAEPEREALLHPKAVVTDRDPNGKAPPPKRAPRGDSRSMRRASAFVLIYRHERFLVRRQGTVGTEGTWSVTEYPSMAAAAHAYAQECSELSGAGFADVRG